MVSGIKSDAANTLAVACLLFAGTALYAKGECVAFPRESSNPVVEVCADADHYSFRIADNLRVFDRADFESRVTEATRDWILRHHEDMKILDHGKIEIWMSVPEANPESAQPRAVVNTEKGQIAFWFDLSANQWVFADKETAIIGPSTYPQSFGHRPERILVKSQPGADHRDVLAALTDSGASSVSNDGGGWYSAFSGIFHEKSLAETSLQNHGDVLKYAQVNSVVEWIADRQMAFSFGLEPQGSASGP